jgi:hypothetical protein
MKNSGMEDAEIDVVLAAVEFPASRDDLLEAAEDTDAAEMVVAFFEMLPAREYSNREEVNEAMSEQKAAGMQKPDEEEKSTDKPEGGEQREDESEE